MRALRRLLLPLLACTVAGACVSRASGPGVRPSWIPVVGGEWIEVPVDQGISTIITRFRGAGLAVADVQRGRPASSTQRLDDASGRRLVWHDTVPVTYALTGENAWRATVEARFTLVSELADRGGIVFRAPIPGGRGGVARNRETPLLSQLFHSRQELRIGGGDSVQHWLLEYGTLWTEADDLPGRPLGDDSLALPFRLTRDGRPLELRPVQRGGEGSRESESVWGLADLSAAGWMMLDGDRVLAVVQLRGDGIMGNNDARAWLPSTASPEERRTRLAVLLMLLNAQSRMMFTREHPEIEYW